MPTLAVYSDYVCPFCYLAWPALSDLRASGWEVELRAYEVRPPPLPLARPGSEAERRRWEEQIAPRAARLGLSMRFPSRRPRTRKAHELAHHARRLGDAAALHERLFRAHFSEGQDIGRIDVLVALAEGVGLERSGVKVELDIDQFADAVIREQQEARELGIRAVPAYVLAGARPRVHTGLLLGAGLRAWLAGEPVAAEAQLETGTDHDL